MQAPARCAQCCCRECGAPQPAVCRRFCVPCLYPSSLRCDHRAASTSTLQAGVFACETFGPMAQLARRVVAAQGCAAVRDITVVAKRSDELSSAPFCLWTQPEVHALLGCWNLEGRVPGSPSGAAPTAGVYAGMHLGGSRAAVVVTEIFDSELLGEGALPTMRHATAHLLEARSAGLWVSISQAGCTLHASRTAVTAASVCLYSGTGVGCAVLRELQRAD